MPSKILVVDDEPDILDVLRYNLEKADFGVLTAQDGERALEIARSERPALVVLDLMLPGIEGEEVCRLLKQDEATRSIPVLMLTAKGQEVDRIVGLELGADDYVVKPFSPREIVLRARAILRRAQPEAEPEGMMRIGPLTVDAAGHRASLSGVSLDLTATEFKLLTTLLSRRGRVQSRDDLLHAVWGYDYAGYGRTVDTHIRRLREKLGEAADMVETVRGVGYRFRKDA
ncbi:MAG: DNA-binding response regulator [Candidatus Handelsmanbacteria bacterium RIFCSPLOWO2_12_FULL_64_10]|uniref:DNA-binding response regulator n=1 Tax=Handelsmanbacteria sp. (strain RIFCSPLOWO2_12_FULL_64_10) TaxID=1817868 RepID=A0A1F6D0Q5_HANXR|nr:MAG: DNA-binding response regulator [Candidatus Handelsmanbacteria bacterium RIFCSPLOWO2_12_FULL_64_10]